MRGSWKRSSASGDSGPEGRKETFYLTTHSTRLYGVGHMVEDHSDTMR